MDDLLKVILGSSAITTVLTSTFAYFLNRKTERQNAVLRREFDLLQLKDSRYIEWKQRTLELLGQIYIHLNRTSLGMRKYYSNLKIYDQFYEDEVIFESNKKIRDIILENGHQIPPELLDYATKLVEHYDQWLRKYQLMRKEEIIDPKPQVYVGLNNEFPFPKEAEELFKKKYIELFNELK